MAVVAEARFDARNIQTLTGAVQQEIARRILTGEIAAGARLSEEKRPAIWTHPSA